MLQIGLNKRINGLKSLIADAEELNFNPVLIGKYRHELNDLSRIHNQDRVKQRERIRLSNVKLSSGVKVELKEVKKTHQNKPQSQDKPFIVICSEIGYNNRVKQLRKQIKKTYPKFEV